MKSRTSFFNFTVLKKDLTRFWPLWGLLLLCILSSFLTDPFFQQESDFMVISFASNFPTLGISQFSFAGLCALLLFGDLFHPRAAGMLHALPLRREGWFFTHTVAAVLIFLPVIAIPELLYLLILEKYRYLALLRLAVRFGFFLFHFSVAAFSVQCAGTRLGAAAVYVTVSFLTQLLLFLGQAFYQPYLYGVSFESPVLRLLCPPMEALSRAFVNITGQYAGASASSYTATFHGIVPGDWWYLLAVVAAGAVFWGLALLLYRRRHIEKAGSFIALRWVAVSFLLILTLTVGAVWFKISSSYILLLVGLGVGFFPGLMLLEKRLKVFRKQTLLAFGIIAVALFATIGIVRADPLKLVEYVPAVDEVESAVFSTNQYVVTSVTPREEAVTLDTPEELQLLEALHKGLITERDDVRSYTDQELTLVYRLKNGRTVRRVYPYPEKSQLRQQANKLLSRLDVFETTDTLRNIVSIRYDHGNDIQAYPDLEIHAEPLQPGDFHYLSDVKISSPTLLDQNPAAIAMWEALQKDCLDGNMSQLWGYQTAICGTLQITFRNEDGSTETLMLYVYTSCKNFRSFLLTAKDAQ